MFCYLPPGKLTSADVASQLLLSLAVLVPERPLRASLSGAQILQKMQAHSSDVAQSI